MNKTIFFIQDFKHNGDPGFTLEKYWVIVEAKCFRNMEKARKIFNEMIITKGNVGKFAVEWIEFYDLEKMYGDEKHQRKLLNRALNEVRDNLEKEIIYELIFKFEKLNGNVNHFNAFYWKYQQFKQNLQIELANKVTKKTDKVQTKPFKKQDVKTAEKKDTQGESIKPPKSSQQLVSNNLKRKVKVLSYLLLNIKLIKSNIQSLKRNPRMMKSKKKERLLEKKVTKWIMMVF